MLYLVSSVVRLEIGWKELQNYLFCDEVDVKSLTELWVINICIIYISFVFYSFLCNPAKDVDLRKWAAEGLAYLTLDADVKEDLVEDTDSLRSIVDLSKVLNSFVVFLSRYQSNVMPQKRQPVIFQYDHNAIFSQS